MGAVLKAEDCGIALADFTANNIKNALDVMKDKGIPMRQLSDFKDTEIKDKSKF